MSRNPAPNRLLTVPEVLGLTGAETPLTGFDIRAIVGAAYSADRAAGVLSGSTDEYARPADAGGLTATHEGHRVSWMNDQRGTWAKLLDVSPHRAGHIPWSTAERIIGDTATPDMAAELIRAVREYRAYMSAGIAACPAGGRPNGRPAGATNGERERRLFAEAQQAWARIRVIIAAGELEQLALFEPRRRPRER